MLLKTIVICILVLQDIKQKKIYVLKLIFLVTIVSAFFYIKFSIYSESINVIQNFIEDTTTQ